MSGWAGDAALVARVLREELPTLAGAYLHGSAALGGFTPASDLDVLVIAAEVPAPTRLAERLLALRTAHPIELSAVTPDAACSPRAPWPYLLHVAAPDRQVVDDGTGDADLIAHYAVARQAGMPLLGPAAHTVIGPVGAGELRRHLAGELRWGEAHADQRYAVLNACRAVVFACEERLMSKVDGGRWWLARHGRNAVVLEALEAQEAGRDLGPCGVTARQFVDAAVNRLAA